jgi:hypothetical protein
MGTFPALLTALVVLSGPPSQTGVSQNNSACPVSTPVQDRPPDDAHSSTFASPNGTWYANDNRTIWAWWWGKTSTGDYKVLWVRPVGAQLKISGRRLDADTPALTAWVPGGYHYSFQASGITFPTDGCWEITASAGDARLKFVVRVP